MIKIAELYLNANAETQKGLREYYNDHCFQLVKPSRRYRIQPDDDWCAMFVSVVAHRAGLSASQFPYEVSVREMCKVARESAKYATKLAGAKSGDLIVYDWVGNGSYSHVGIVKEVGQNHIITIEGNYSGTVKHRTLKKNSQAVRGFVQLDGVVKLNQAENDRLDALVAKVMRGELFNGSNRARLLGGDYDEVQRRVNALLS